MKRNRFTLLELLSSIGILFILIGLILGSFSYATKIAKKKKTKAQITAIEVALTQYKSEWGFYPESLDTNGDDNPDVMELNQEWWNSIETVPYTFGTNPPVQKDLIDNHELGLTEDPVYKYVDVYGNPFYYQSPSPLNGNMMNPEKFDLWSKGPDGMHGDAGSDVSDAQSVNARDSDDITNWSK